MMLDEFTMLHFTIMKNFATAVRYNPISYAFAIAYIWTQSQYLPINCVDIRERETPRLRDVATKKNSDSEAGHD